tara:strand:+ start:261 stop:926 length:666 start_codon:yes stop_codon:yes gene_type:complete
MLRDRGLVILDSLGFAIRTIYTPGAWYNPTDLAWQMAIDVMGGKKVLEFAGILGEDDEPDEVKTEELRLTIKQAEKELKLLAANDYGLLNDLHKALEEAVRDFMPLGKYPESYEIEDHLQDHIDYACMTEYLQSTGLDVSQEIQGLANTNAGCLKTLNWWTNTDENELEDWRVWWGVAPEETGPARFILDLQKGYTRWGIGYPPHWARGQKKKIAELTPTD